uniref:39S ribosomal protein L24, mitochondrial n=2 Tax=Lygus hesperus TaxID=30085 RepID=A0A0A9YST8_LYGHE
MSNAAKLRSGTAVNMRKFRKATEAVSNPVGEWKIVTGDRVSVISGEGKGKQGIVLSVKRKHNLVFVSGIKMGVRMVKQVIDGAPQLVPQERELGIHYSNVQLVDPVTNKPTRVNVKRDPETDTLVRVAVKSGAIIPKPAMNWTPERTFNAHTDTPAQEVLRKTYVPSSFCDVRDAYLAKQATKGRSS